MRDCRLNWRRVEIGWSEFAVVVDHGSEQIRWSDNVVEEARHEICFAQEGGGVVWLCLAFFCQPTCNGQVEGLPEGYYVLILWAEAKLMEDEKNVADKLGR